jgi:hypothetical protein
MHAAVDLLSFDKVESQVIALGAKPSHIIPGIQCNLNPPSELSIYQESRCEMLYGSKIGFVNIAPAGEPGTSEDIGRLTEALTSQWPHTWGESQYYFENPYYPLPSGWFTMDPIAEYSRNWHKPAAKEFRITTAKMPRRIHREIDLADVTVRLLPAAADGH